MIQYWHKITMSCSGYEHQFFFAKKNDQIKTYIIISQLFQSDVYTLH